MLHLHRSETGMFVLVDPRSGTVVTGEDLGQLHEEMRARRPDADSDADAGGTPRPTTARGWTRPAAIAGLLVVAALPFVWLSVLHYSLGRMLADLRPNAPRAAERERGEDDPVVVELKRLHQLIAALQSRVDAVERTGAKAPAKRDDDEGDEEGEADDAKADDAKADDAKADDAKAPGLGTLPGAIPRPRPRKP